MNLRVVCGDNPHRWYVHDGARYLQNSKGKVRRFRTCEAAERFAAALNRGVKRPSGTRP